MTDHPSSLKTLTVGIPGDEILTFDAAEGAHLIADFTEGNLFIVKECPSGRTLGFVPADDVRYSFAEEWTDVHDPNAEPEPEVSASIDDFLSALMTPADEDDEGDDEPLFEVGDRVRVSLPATLYGNASLVLFGDEGAIEAEVEQYDPGDDTLLVKAGGKRQWIDTSCATHAKGTEHLAEWERELLGVTEPDADAEATYFNPGDKVRVSLPAAVSPDETDTAFMSEYARGETHVDAVIVGRSGPTYFVEGPERSQFVHPAFLTRREETFQPGEKVRVSLPAHAAHFPAYEDYAGESLDAVVINGEDGDGDYFVRATATGVTQFVLGEYLSRREAPSA